MIEASIQSGNKQPIDLSRLADVRRRAFEQGISVIQILDETGGYTPDELVQQLGKLLHMPVLEMKAIHALSPAFDRLPFAEAIMHECVLFRRDQNYLLAVSNPFSSKLRAWAEERFDMAVEWYLVHPADLTAFFTQQEKTMRAMDQVLPSTELDNIQSGIEDLSLKSINAGTSQVVRLVHSTLYDAHKSQASDIHLEPRREQGQIRFRIDGVLNAIYQLPPPVMSAVTSRIKILGRMDVAEKRRPQDGRIKTRTPAGREIELRLSTMPTAFGEKCVLRIFDPDTVTKNFGQLGFAPAEEAIWRTMIARPHGIVLVTGPTGSGKTTTLYTTLKHLANPEVNVCTVEDPIEMVVPELNQMQVHPAIDLTFAQGIRTLLRQDPDIIMVGEIRDLEAAQMAVQAALTGHLVLSTLHTNDAASAVTRLLDLGIPHYLIQNVLIGVMAQRLVRTLCPHCKGEGQMDPALWDALIRPWPLPKPVILREPRGCPECRNTGYLGRVGLYELLSVTPELRRLLRPDMDADDLRRRACEQGMRPLRVSAALQIAAGLTTFEEIIQALPPLEEE